MKKLLIGILALSTIVIMALDCSGDLIVPDEVTVNFSTNIIPVITDLEGGRVADIPGFEQKYDTVDLLANHITKGFFYKKQAIGDIVHSITISPGLYDFYMDSEGHTIFNNHLKFSALLDSILITEDVSLILPTETLQALLLIDKTGITEAPFVNHTVVNDSSVWGIDVPMIEDDMYWYLYLYGDWGYEIDYTYNGVSGQLSQVLARGKVYIYNLKGVGIEITDPFSEIIYNGG